MFALIFYYFTDIYKIKKLHPSAGKNGKREREREHTYLKFPDYIQLMECVESQKI